MELRGEVSASVRAGAGVPNAAPALGWKGGAPAPVQIRQETVMRACWIALLVSVTVAAGPGPEKLFFTRVFPNPGQIGLFIAAADGTGERALLASPDVDYNPTWSADGAWIAFTSER